MVQTEDDVEVLGVKTKLAAEIEGSGKYIQDLSPRMQKQGEPDVSAMTVRPLVSYASFEPRINSRQATASRILFDDPLPDEMELPSPQLHVADECAILSQSNVLPG
jgi:hypothetical protein